MNRMHLRNILCGYSVNYKRNSQEGEDSICVPSAGFQPKSQSCEGLHPFSGGHMQDQWESGSRNPWSFAVPSGNTNKIMDYVNRDLWRGDLITCLSTEVSFEEKSRKYFNLPLSFCCRRWRGESVLQLLEIWSLQIHLMGTAESRKKGLVISSSRLIPFRLWHPYSLLTKLHANVLIWILLPQFIITVCVTHEGENHVLNDALEKNKVKKLSLKRSNIFSFGWSCHDRYWSNIKRVPGCEV